MIKLIRETPKYDIFSRQQWWLAGKSYEVLVSYEKPLCYFHITDKIQKKDISWTIASNIGKINGTQLDTTATIDSQFVKVPESHVKEFLLEIDELGMGEELTFKYSKSKGLDSKASLNGIGA